MPGFFTHLFLPSQRQISSVMSKATVSVLPVMPRIQGGGLQCVNRLEPAMRLQQVNLHRLNRARRPARCQRGGPHGSTTERKPCSGHHASMQADTGTWRQSRPAA